MDGRNDVRKQGMQGNDTMAGMGDGSASIDPALEGPMAEDEEEEEDVPEVGTVETDPKRDV
jgi:hypothetical protein